MVFAGSQFAPMKKHWDYALDKLFIFGRIGA
jgi:hypothetical protein